MKVLKSVVFALLISQVIFMSACTVGKEESDGFESEDVDTLMITMIPKSSSNPVFAAAKISAMREAKALSGKNTGLEVVIDWQPSQSDNASGQTEIIRDAIKNNVDAIAVSCSDIDSLTSAIDQAVESGIPVMTFDSDCPDSKRFAFFGPDDFELGRQLLNNLSREIEGKGIVAILGGYKNSPNLQKRIDGIKEAVIEFPEIEIIGEFHHLENEESAIAVMDSVQNLYPDLSGWAMVGSWPFFGDKLLGKIEPGKIKIAAVDALPVELKYIENNYVQILLGQPTFKWGKVSVETIVDKVYFKKDVEEKNILKTIPVTIKNLGGWSRQLRAWGYKNIPEKYLPL